MRRAGLIASHGRWIWAGSRKQWSYRRKSIRQRLLEAIVAAEIRAA